ncbi:CCR4-NOT transcription complex subunit 10-like [Rhopilema esculentum]|uniref:CCR4-NOT transcription complex subunit 10-like n=1 Tax=Rhopilema esculentum TaxID=499914 RepID=UPI0031D44F48
MSDQARDNTADSEQEKQLSHQALNEFKNSKFDECLGFLKKLGELRPNDSRILLNKAITEFYQSNCCKTDELRKQIGVVKKQLSQAAGGTSDELENLSLCFLLYNEGIIHYHLKQPKTAINIIEKLFKIIEPLDDHLAVKVCFFLVELYLSTFKTDQANGMLKYIEDVLFAPKTFSHLQSNDNKQQGDNENSQSVSQSTTSKEMPEEFKMHIYMAKAKMYLIRKALKECKREIKSVLNMNANNSDALFLKSNYEYTRENYPKAIKLLNSVPLQTIVAMRGQSLVTLYYNNMSCIHFKLGKYNLGIFYARKALEENILAMRSLPSIEKNHQLSGRPLQTLAMNKRSEIMYNMGVQLLFAGRPVAAFDCFMESNDLFECHPRFWLRLAESCIMVHQQFQRDIIRSPVKKSSYVRGVIGAGTHRKIVLSPVHDVNKIHRHESQSSAMPAPTIEFGSICLSNAMKLLPKATDIDDAFRQLAASMQEAEGAEKEKEKSFALGAHLAKDLPGEPISIQELHKMRLSVIACRAYISLGLGDHVKSLDYARELLSQSMLPGAYKYLGHLYAAESLIKLDRISEAIAELSPEKITDISTSLESNPIDSKKEQKKELFPNNVQEARAVMYINLACACSLRNEFDKAKRMLQQLVNSRIPDFISTHAILLSAYIELQTGNIGTALEVIKRGEVLPSGRLVDRIDAARQTQLQQQQHQQHFYQGQMMQGSQYQTHQMQPIQPPQQMSSSQQRPFAALQGYPTSGHRSLFGEDSLGSLQRPF